MAITTVFNHTATVAGNDGGTNANTTTVQKFSVGSLSAAAGSLIRVTGLWGNLVLAPQSGVVTSMWIGQAAASGDPYDFATTPTQITQGGGIATWDFTQSGTSISDWITLPQPFDNTKIYLISKSFAGGIAVNVAVGIEAAAANCVSYFKSASPGDAPTVDKTGYSTSAKNLQFFTKIEIQSVDATVFGMNSVW